MSSFSIQGEASFAVSDVLRVKPGQVIIDTDLTRFREIHIVDDPKTGERGTLVINDGGAVTSFKSDDLIVNKDKTINAANTYNNVLFVPGNRLTIA